MKKPFGMSVLTNSLANRLLPEVVKQDQLRAVKHIMIEHHVDPAIQVNVLQWQKEKLRRNGARA